MVLVNIGGKSFISVLRVGDMLLQIILRNYGTLILRNVRNLIENGVKLVYMTTDNAPMPQYVHRFQLDEIWM